MWSFSIKQGLGDITSELIYSTREAAKAAAIEWALAQPDGFACVVVYAKSKWGTYYMGQIKE